LLDNSWIKLLAVDDAVLEKALKMVKDKMDRRFSLVDAANIVLMEKHQIDIIFSFDHSYEGVPVQRGYNTRYIQRIG
jgi:predicted nucleic acid-binding protein